jgi:hypothetical protein
MRPYTGSHVQNLETPFTIHCGILAMLTLSEIQDYRKLAAQYPNNQSAKIITRILDDFQEVRTELNRLRARQLDKAGPYNSSTLMPFGKWKGEPLGEVPDNYLEWWLRKNPDWDLLFIEANYASYPERAFAIQKMKMHDYITNRFNHA